jgi:hypothetical protein
MTGRLGPCDRPPTDFPTYMIAIQWRTAYKIPKIGLDEAICAAAPT